MESGKSRTTADITTRLRELAMHGDGKNTDMLNEAAGEIERLRNALHNIRKCYLDPVSFVIMRDEISEIVCNALQEHRLSLKKSRRL